MNKVNFTKLFLASIIATISFLVLEVFIETIFSTLFNLSESVYFQQLNIRPGGLVFQVINLLIFYAEMILIMTIYVLIRYRYTSNITAGLITSGIFLGLGFLILGNFTNLGILSVEMWMTSILFNLFELPPAILAGAAFYGQG